MIEFFLAVIITSLDQWSKYYIQSTMSQGASIPVVPGIFHITYVLNPGAAFGMFEHQRVFFVIVAIVLIGVMIWFHARLPKVPLMRAGLGLLAGGAVGNVIDRIQTGYVVDFFDFRIWPVFNIADIAICTGVAFIIYIILTSPCKEGELGDE